VILAGGERIEVWVVRVKSPNDVILAIDANPQTVTAVLRAELPEAKVP
jgi:sRNA-binding carbon storage regulator CsrA